MSTNRPNSPFTIVSALVCFDEGRFRRAVGRALTAARTVLDNERNPKLPEDRAHSYDDKFVVVDVVTNVALSSTLNCLEALGLNAKSLRTLQQWHASGRSVTLRLLSEERCKFIREATREEESATKNVVEYKSAGITVGKRVDKTVTTITEYFYDFSCTWSLVAFPGSTPDEAVVLQGRTGAYEILSLSKELPRPSVCSRDAIDLNVTFLLKQVDAAGSFAFRIDRAHKNTHTPRRNDAVEDALSFVEELDAWAERVGDYFSNTLFPVHVNHGLDLGALEESKVFVPVLPLLEAGKPAAAEEAAPASSALVSFRLAAPGGAVLASADVSRLLAEERRSLSEKCSDLAKAFPDAAAKLISVAEAQLLLTLAHARDVASSFADSVNYIEELLRKQLVAAIGKEVQPVDFAAYMDFHHRRLFRSEYQPRPFSYAVRRPDHYPEGVLSLEARSGPLAMAEPVRTLVARSELRSPFRFNIHAAATVAFTGDVLLHAYLRHEFSGDAGLTLTLNARARQFSSFLVLVGRIGGPGLFDPQYGIMVQNKDEITIPLDLETIPSAQEFKEAVESLSPEQMRFASAFRAMQLASTLFGVCVIQVKPQLERLLRLSDDALTKEIRLTQELLELFIKYQIPSDLLSYGGPAAAPAPDKVAAVQRHVAAMQEMIQGKKQDEVKQSVLKNVFSKLSKGGAAPSADRAKGVKTRNRKDKDYKSETKKKKSVRSKKDKEKEYKEEERAPAMEASESAAQPEAIEAANDNNVADSAPEGGGGDTAPGAADEAGPKKGSTGFDSGAESSVRDFTKIPKELDARMEALDEDSALRPTILNVGQTWTKRSQQSLLSTATEATLDVTKQRLEKQSCYDLLDALTKSGALAVEGATLHIVMAATHCFDKSVINTLVQDNVNPIDKVERSALIVATTIHGLPARALVQPDQVERLETISAPALFLESGKPK